MAITDACGVVISLSVQSASPHEVTLVEITLDERFIDDVPQKLIGDRAYDSDPLDKRLKEKGIELIAPHRGGRKKSKTQDGRKLRRYKRRWKVERFFAWLIYIAQRSPGRSAAKGYVRGYWFFSGLSRFIFLHQYLKQYCLWSGLPHPGKQSR